MKSPKALFERKAFLYPTLFFIFVLLSFIAYSNILTTFFLADDFELIRGAKNSGPFAPWTPGAAQGFFRPLVTLCIFMDYRLWGLNPAGYHATNIILHAFNSLLVVFISLSLISRIKSSPIGPWPLAVLSGMMFLLLPCHTEAVTWISGRTDLLATLFCLSSFQVYILYLEKRKGSILALSMLFFLFGLLAKESVIIYPLLILFYEAYEGYFSGRTTGKWLRCLWVCIIFILTFMLGMAIKYAASGSFILGYGLQAHFNFNFLKVLKDYLVFLTRPFVPPIPIDFQTFIQLKSIIIFRASKWIGAGAGILLLGLLIFLIPWFSQKLSRIQPQREIIGLLLFLFITSVILFIPALSLGVSVRDTYNERFIYLPSAYYSIFLTTGLIHLVSKKSYRLWMFIGLFLFFVVSLHRLNGNWQVAGEISRNAVHDLLKYEGQEGKLYLISLPGEMRGAHIHVSIQDAMDLFGVCKPVEIIIISYLYMCRPEDGITVTREGDGYQVNTSNPQGYFFSYVYPLNQGPVMSRFFDFTPLRPNLYNLSLRDVRNGDHLISLSHGRLVVLARD